MEAKVISANRLGDGLVVYLKRDNGWAEYISDAQVYSDKVASDAAIRKAHDAEEACVIVNPYLIHIDENGGQYNPTKYRELIRAMGPTVRLDLGKQAGS